MCSIRSIIIGSALIVTLNFAASCAVIALFTDAAPLHAGNSVTRQPVDRRYKTDRLMLFKSAAPPRLPNASDNAEPRYRVKTFHALATAAV